MERASTPTQRLIRIRRPDSFGAPVRIVCCRAHPRRARGGTEVETYDEYHLLNEAIDCLVAEMARLEPNLIHDEVREVLSEVVRRLIRNAGPVG